MFGSDMKYRAIILEKIGEQTWRKLKEVKFKNEKDEVITYESKSFPVTAKMYIYTEKNTSYVFCDYDTEKILTLHENGIGINAKFLDRMLTTGKIGIVGQLMNAIKTDMGEKSNWKQYLSPILIFIVGAVIGYLAGS